jgi:uncharacterized protein (AIM24 family)
MIRTNLFQNTEAHKIVDNVGCFSVLEFERDISVNPEASEIAYFASKMNVRKRQVIANLQGQSVTVQAGAMQLMIGNISAATNVSGVGDLMKKFVGSKVTGETTIKPQYAGEGLLVLEPTYKYIILEDLTNWNGNMVIEDGLFLACDGTVRLSVTARNTISSAALGGEGFFNTALTGNGTVVLESPVPKEELFIVDLENDTIKIDGNMAIAWSNSLQFTVERTTKTLVGSAASGEGLVNVYRGTGRVLIAPVAYNPSIRTPLSK